MENPQIEQKMMVTIDDLVVEFASSMAIGAKAIQSAAETYVAALTRFPLKAERVFAERFPQIRRETWQLMTDIGRRKLPPQAMMMLPGAVEKLREAKLPRRIVESAANTMVRVFDVASSKYKEVRFTHLTEGQAELVFNPISHSIRTVEQQKRYFERNLSSRPTPMRVDAPSFAVVDDGIVFRRGGKMSFAQMREILAQTEGVVA